MHLLLLALAGALPALVAMWYFDRLDAQRPEPVWSKRKVMIAGILSVIPCIGIELALMQAQPSSLWGGILWQAFVVAGLTEELAKVACLKWVIWRRPEFDERLDGIVYGTRAGLGFALIENILYLSQTSTTGHFVGMFIGRALLAIPLHAITAGVMGYYAARRRFDQVGPGIWGGCAIAVLIHGVYDAAVFALPFSAEQLSLPFAPQFLFVVPILCVVLGARMLRRLARVALEQDNLAHARQALPARLFPFTFTG
jgi:RsiW-degrading membrane proteinase PrsW (M82 family)